MLSLLLYFDVFHQCGLKRKVFFQGPRSKFSSWGAKEECVKENFGGFRAGGEGSGHACGFLVNFSKVKENVNNDKTIDFFPHFQ